jgi:flagellar biosynthesis protein FlhA
MSHDLTTQLLKDPQPIALASVAIGAFAFVPGFPKITFLLLASGCAYFAWATKKAEKLQHSESEEKVDAEVQTDDKTPVEELLDVDILSILVGVRLISMVDPRKKSSVFDRIGALRRKFAQQLGMIIPLVRLKDNINLDPTAYEIKLYDHVIASGKIEPERFLAMDSGSVSKPVEGMPTQEPVYGLPALWITEADKEAAEISGYTVIDPESVLITHLSETLNRYANELLTREDVQKLVERLRQTQPSLVGEVVGEVINVGLLQKILQNLLRENVSVRDLTLILETLGQNGPRTKNATLLTEVSRKSLVRAITEQHKDLTGTINAITLDPILEHHLISTLNQQGDSMSLEIPPEMAAELNRNIAEAWKSAMDRSYDNVIILCDARIRSALFNLIERTIQRLPVIAYDEIVPGTNTVPVETVKLTETASMLNAHNQTVGV